jgi:hypothetical protein
VKTGEEMSHSERRENITFCCNKKKVEFFTSSKLSHCLNHCDGHEKIKKKGQTKEKRDFLWEKSGHTSLECEICLVDVNSFI